MRDDRFSRPWEGRPRGRKGAAVTIGGKDAPFNLGCGLEANDAHYGRAVKRGTVKVGHVLWTPGGFVGLSLDRALATNPKTSAQNAANQLCRSLDTAHGREAKARRSAAQKAARVPRAPKPRTTTRSWMRDPQWTLTLIRRPAGPDGELCALVDAEVWTLNMMELAENMCRRKGWDRAFRMAVEQAKVQQFHHHGTPAAHGRRLWDYTMEGRGRRGTSGIRIMRGNRGAHSSGRGGSGYGVSMTVDRAPASPRGAAGVMMTLLHEIAHVVHLGSCHHTRKGSKTRPHDLAYNVILCEMARQLWGWDREPHTAGWSVGKGYAPSRRLRRWLETQISEDNPKIMRYLTRDGCVGDLTGTDRETLEAKAIQIARIDARRKEKVKIGSRVQTAILRVLDDDEFLNEAYHSTGLEEVNDDTKVDALRTGIRRVVDWVHYGRLPGSGGANAWTELEGRILGAAIELVRSQSQPRDTHAAVSLSHAVEHLTGPAETYRNANRGELAVTPLQ